VSDHFVVLGVARVRSAWFRDISRWSTSAALPVDFVKCVSTDEMRARLSSGRPFSALIIDAALPALDRDLVDLARGTGCAVIAIDDGRGRRDWAHVGVDAVLSEPIDRDMVLAVLKDHAQPVRTSGNDIGLTRDSGDFTGWRGQLVAVLGGGGVGASTVAMAIAQGLAADVRRAGLVALADLARRADLALLHDAGDVVPGVQELAEAHRGHALTCEDVRTFLFDCPDRGYHLLLGLRRSRDWSVLRPRAFEAALDGLRQSYRVMVTDVDADLEGEAECGSVDVEERNLMARTSVARADVVVTVGAAGVGGVHRLARITDDALRFGVEAARLLPIVNRAPRSPRARSEITRTLSTALETLGGEPVDVASPLFVTERRRLDETHRDAAPLPRQLVDPLAAAAAAMLERSQPPAAPEPEPVKPGSLGSWGG